MRLPENEPFRVGGDAEMLALPSGGECVVLARGDVLVNGCSSLPFQVLADRDELRIDGNLYYFSTQSPVEVITFVKGEKDIRCARCSVSLRDEDAVVYCSVCKAAYHADCFDYAPECSFCRTSTGGISWTPGPPERGRE